jgi:uncharacterized protein YqjF (DUF2071 family)
MRWHDLAFLHWPVGADGLRALVPSLLDLDLFEGQAWVGITPFRMSGVRPRWLPSMPGVSAFPELNVRTYVSAGGQPGVWFFSLDAGSSVAVRIARVTFGLPYYRARMALRSAGEHVQYESVRTHRGAPPAAFLARYGPTGDPARSRPGSLDLWLTERYCLYAVDSAGTVYRGEIEHEPWPLQAAHAEIEANTMATAARITLPSLPPRVHFARRLDVVAWPRRPV